MFVFFYLSSFYFRETSLCHLTCKSHSNCYDDEKCIDGKCQSGCTTDEHCKSGFKCFHNECKKSCQIDQNCNDKGHYGSYCHIDYKVCLGQCSEDADCSGGYTCFEKRCLKHCSLSEQCNNNQYCDRYVYRNIVMICREFKIHLSFSNNLVCKENCKDDSSCGAKEICVNGQCQSGCYTDKQCGKYQNCVQNSLVLLGHF